LALDVRLSTRAAAGLDALTRQQRGRLNMSLRVAARRGPAGLLHLAAPRCVAACEVIPEAGALLVYAVLVRTELDEMLLGPRAFNR
jgi:hypothetical protein